MLLSLRLWARIVSGQLIELLQDIEELSPLDLLLFLLFEEFVVLPVFFHALFFSLVFWRWRIFWPHFLFELIVLGRNLTSWLGSIILQLSPISLSKVILLEEELLLFIDIEMLLLSKGLPLLIQDRLKCK